MNILRTFALTFCAIMTLSPTPAEAQSLREVFRRTNPSVVIVRATAKTPATTAKENETVPQGLGSGVLIAPDGKVLTAAHVVASAAGILVEFLDGQPIPARVIASAPFADIALLQLSRVPANAAVAKLGDSNKIEAGDQAFTIGAPYGANHSLSAGWISARRVQEKVFEDVSALEVFQTDIAIYEGNSGGPLFNLDGEVIGIISHVLTREGASTGPGFAVASNVAKKLMLEQRRIWFGVETRLLELSLAEAFNLPQAAGLLVQSVAEGSLAARLGVREGSLRIRLDEMEMLVGGDVILDVLGRQVPPSGGSVSEFLSALDQMKPGDRVTVRVLRAGQVVTLTTKVAE
jgi:S1-C subfamily serine protease